MALTQVDQGLLGQYAQYTGFKNRIINGAMVIDQRNAGASVTPTNGAYTLDRWQTFATQASKFTVQQNAGSVTTPAGFVKYLGCTSSSAYTVGASEIFGVAQQIEGLNVSDLGWGTANAKAVTVSFWAYSSLTGTFAGHLQNYAQTYSYVFTYSVASANTWTYVTVTIPGQTSGVWATDNTSFGTLRFMLGVGSTYQTSSVNQWVSGNYWSTSSATSVVGTNGATFYITGVQLEKGSTATSFDYRPYGTELMLCQRYFQKLSNAIYGAYINVSNSYNYCTWFFKVQMRASPTVTGFVGTSQDTTGIDLAAGYGGTTQYASFSVGSTASAEL